MATKSIFTAMLSQKPIAAPQVQSKGVKIQKPPGIKEFANLGNKTGRSSIGKFDPDVASGLWGRALNFRSRKGGNNV